MTYTHSNSLQVASTGRCARTKISRSEVVCVDLLLDSGVAIEQVQDLLDHKHITTTQIYDKRRRSVRDSASHKVPL